MMAIVVNGDACKPEDIEKAFAAIDGVDAVVSTIGGTTADPTADSKASCLVVSFFKRGTAVVKHFAQLFRLACCLSASVGEHQPY